ncbi:MAG: hypothetical protein Q8N23_09895 [Archangium sp.]|nr:hypothetical protein [Archangium sp.]MDP3152970.1 hypothetical protein [Archangium sp.]MDP3569089.1 hypothetical protein [Archangium sp.]
MKVLLARPNDFLVYDMSAWLRSLGLEPVRLSKLSELTAHPVTEIAGLVLSSAVTSAIPESLGAAMGAVRKVFPRKPVLISGLARLESARVGLARELEGATLKGPAEPAAWGQPGVLLYVHGDQLHARDPDLQKAARQHLGLD